MTSSSTLAEAIAVAYEKKLLTRATPQLHLLKFGKSGKLYKPIGVNCGKSVIWTLYTNMGDMDELSDNGDSGTAADLSATNVSTTLKNYGKFTLITEFVSLIAIDPVIDSAIPILGDCAGKWVDKVIRDELSNGTAIIQNDKADVSDLAVSDKLNMTLIKKGVRALEAADYLPPPLTSGLFPFFTHPYAKYDLINDDTNGLIDQRKYLESGKKELEMYKIGDVFGAKGFMSTNIRIKASTVKYIETLMFADEAFGVVDILGNKGKGCQPRVIVHEPGSSGVYDPLNLKGSVGVAVNMACKILHPTAVQVLKHSCTDQGNLSVN